MDYAAALSGPAPTGSCLPVVGAADVEAIVAAWTGVPVEQMSEDETAKLAQLVGGWGGGDGGLAGWGVGGASGGWGFTGWGCG